MPTKKKSTVRKKQAAKPKGKKTSGVKRTAQPKSKMVGKKVVSRTAVSSKKTGTAKRTGKKALKKAAAKAKPAAAGKARSGQATVQKKAAAKAKPSEVKALKGAKKSQSHRTTVKKTVVAKLKSTSRPPKASKEYPPVRPSPISRPSPAMKAKSKAKKEKKLTAKELEQFRKLLLELRDKVLDGIQFLSGDNLNRSQRDVSGDLSGYSLHMADQGTDNYDREFALNLVSSEQDILYEIDEALRRIDDGTDGICEMSGEPIERARLKALPHARYSVTAQSEMERGQKRYRPFGPTLSHGGH